MADEAPRADGAYGSQEDEGRRAEAALRALAVGSASRGDQHFFRVLSEQLARALGVRWGFGSELIGPGKVRVLAFWCDAKGFLPPIEYALAGTPCQSVVAGGQNHFPSKVQELFPSDPMLRRLGAEAYLGTPIVGRDGRVLGLLAAMDDKPLEAPPQTRATLHLFAQRAAAELEREQAEEALRQSSEKYRKVFDSVLDAVFIFDLDSHLVVDVNDAFLRLYGYARAEIVGHDSLRLSADPDVLLRIERLRLDDRLGIELRRHRRKDGSVFPCETYVVRFAQAGRQLGCVVVRDVADRQRLEEQVRTSERMASVGMLAAGIAHEINNPLAYVLGNLGFTTELLPALEARARAAGVELEELGKLGELSQALHDAMDGARRVRDIVGDLKTFSRSDGLRRSAVDVREVLEVALRMSSNELRHRTRLERDFAPVALVEANESRLAQVFLNLVGNALQALPDRPAAENILGVSAFARADGAEVVVEVRDNGSGIAAEHLPHIFDPFFTTRQREMGMGLGLSTCRNIISALGGRIEVESAPERGSVFRVILPALGSGARAEEGTAPKRASEGGQRRRVLVIDDEPLVCSMIRRTLGASCEVVACTSPDEALAKVAAGEPFDAVLCDLMMPARSGMEVFAELQRLRPELAARTGFLTGGAFTESARAFLARQGERALEKPFTADELRELVLGLTG